jgi:TFIIF-interacting CTD phosphatase-like protein
MVHAQFYEKLIEISNVMEEKGDGISYIRNEADYYTIGTRKYSEEIAKYLDENGETWEGTEDYVNEKKKKGKRSEAAKRIGYIWKISLTAAK